MDSCSAPHSIQGTVVKADSLVGEAQDVDTGNLLSTVYTVLGNLDQVLVGHDGAVDGMLDGVNYSIDCPPCHETWRRKASHTARR